MTVFRETAQGWRATRLLIALRWRSLRKPGVRWGIIGGALFFAFGLTAVMNLGYVATIAAQQPDTAQGIYARLWMNSLMYGHMFNMGTFALGGAFAAALLAPFTGTSTNSLVAAEDLSGVRPARLHRYFDSLLINAFSGLGLLQLLLLTGVASLMTIDGSHLAATCLAWSIWVFAILLTTAFGWTLELITRKFGILFRTVFFVLLAGIVVAAITMDENHGLTLFGLDEVFTTLIREGINGWTPNTVAAPLIVMVASAVTFPWGLLMARTALALPLPTRRQGQQRRARALGSNPSRIAFGLLLRSFTRVRQIRRPLLAMAALGLPAMLLFPMQESIEFTLVAAVPLAVALGWSVNTYGVLGSGMVWLASMPKVLDRMPRVAALTQMAMSFALITLFWLASFLTGHTDLTSGVRLALNSALSIIAVTGLSTYLSVARPIQARLSDRGDTLLPPITGIGYLLALLIVGPLPVVMHSTLEDPTQKNLIVAVVILVALLCYARGIGMWNNREHRARVVAATSVS